MSIINKNPNGTYTVVVSKIGATLSGDILITEEAIQAFLDKQKERMRPKTIYTEFGYPVIDKEWRDRLMVIHEDKICGTLIDFHLVTINDERILIGAWCPGGPHRETVQNFIDTSGDIAFGMRALHDGKKIRDIICWDVIDPKLKPNYPSNEGIQNV